MKNIFKFFGLLSLIVFSFFYTDKVMDVALEQDSIMIEINKKKQEYEISPIDATITEKGLIPGINGKSVDIEASYNNMRNIGIFHADYLIYKQDKPNITMYNYYQKYIIQGNPNKKMVSIIFILNQDNYLEELIKIVKDNNIKINYFVDYKFLNTHSNLIKALSNTNIYSYGSNGEYTPDTLLFSNNLLERITKQDLKFCLAPLEKKQTLDLCSKYEMFTIIPNIYIKNNLYKEIKNSVTNGSIILIEMNSSNITELDIAINYIQAKGLEIEYLSNLLTEELENV